MLVSRADLIGDVSIVKMQFCTKII